ncbi:heterokaryon incompatibility protein-domain-containing protein [Paraphoma chrysanthemicola]|uniref:Heterokaryon incompatibility protein-domain-containing protein n=1 Tax=Paraphoma chrysanthemicola TaxID=798071 RepID=A0A8K0QSN2_9PLEO|nr:heterokaryon incompatibility protein-domain-containing protein [Paraphoma chrysanthemicola]
MAAFVAASFYEIFEAYTIRWMQGSGGKKETKLDDYREGLNDATIAVLGLATNLPRASQTLQGVNEPKIAKAISGIQTFVALSEPLREQLFHYPPLSAAGSIRTIILEPAQKHTDVIVCSLHETPLEDTPTFTALSYVWGSKNGNKSIRCDGKVIAVTDNCRKAMRRLRSEAGGKQLRLWIDSICIDQSSMTEKSSQVSMMGDIYARADRVVAWLGTGTWRTAQAFDLFSRIGSLRDYEGGEWTVSTMGVAQELCFETESAEGIRGFPELVREIFNRPWFSRVWTIQEVTLANEDRVWFSCGTRTIQYRHLKSAFSILVSSDLLYAQFPGLENTLALQLYLSDSLRAKQRLHNSHEDDRIGAADFSMSKVLSFLPSKQAADPRDKVFALYAVLKALGVDLPTPDYTKSLHQVQVETARAAMEFDQTLEFLAYASSRVGQTSDLVSWAPDFQSGTHGNWLKGSLEGTGLISRPPPIADPAAPPTELHTPLKRRKSMQILMSTVPRARLITRIWKTLGAHTMTNLVTSAAASYSVFDATPGSGQTEWIAKRTTINEGTKTAEHPSGFFLSVPGVIVDTIAARETVPDSTIPISETVSYLKRIAPPHSMISIPQSTLQLSVDAILESYKLKIAKVVSETIFTLCLLVAVFSHHGLVTLILSFLTLQTPSSLWHVVPRSYHITNAIGSSYIQVAPGNYLANLAFPIIDAIVYAAALAAQRGFDLGVEPGWLYKANSFIYGLGLYKTLMAVSRWQQEPERDREFHPYAHGRTAVRIFERFWMFSESVLELFSWTFRQFLAWPFVICARDGLSATLPLRLAVALIVQMLYGNLLQALKTIVLNWTFDLAGDYSGEVAIALLPHLVFQTIAELIRIVVRLVVIFLSYSSFRMRLMLQLGRILVGRSARSYCPPGIDVTGKDFFETEHGRRGCAGGGIRKGDVIALVVGVRWPLILRRAAFGYSVVGVGYVDGIMNGEEWIPNADRLHDLKLV